MFTTSEVEYSTVLASASAVVDLSVLLPEMVSRARPEAVAFLDSDECWGTGAGSMLSALARWSGDYELHLLELDGPEGWMSYAGHRGAAVIPVDASGETYRRLVEVAGRPGAGSFVQMWRSVVVTSPSHGFAYWAERGTDLAIVAFLRNFETLPPLPGESAWLSVDEALDQAGLQFGLKGLPPIFASRMRQLYGPLAIIPSNK